MENDRLIELNDGRKLSYCEFGDPKGKPLFFFHGWPGSRLSGQETDMAAKKLGIRVICPDRPGFGLSDFQRNRKLLDWPDDVVQLAEYLEIKKFSIMGVSGGGPYAAVCACKIPDRINKVGIVVGLAPVNILGNLDGLALANRLCWKYYYKHNLTRLISSWIAQLEFKYLPILGKYMSFRAKEDKQVLKDKKSFPAISEAFRQGIKGPAHDLKVDTDDWGFDLKNIKVPVFLWYGAKDKNVSPSCGKYYHSQIPGSQLFIDPNGGHLARYCYEEKILKQLMI
jgi:pimeloyl-ACP methyl ester carboxylesterase